MSTNNTLKPQQQSSKPKKDMSPLIKRYSDLLAKCMSTTSVEANDARYALSLVDQELRLEGLRATIKIGVEKID